MLRPNPYDDDIRSGTLGCKQVMRELVHPLNHMRTQWKDGPMSQQVGSHQTLESAGVLILDFQPPEW